MSNRAVFLDRDGIINVDKGYVHAQSAFEWVPGIFDLVRRVRGAGALAIVVTNQSGIARGYYSEQTFQALTAWMCARFTAEDAPLTRVYHCPHLTGPDGEDHPLRKPNPGMLLAAQRDFAIDMPASAMLGDKWTDMAAALNAGVGHAGFVRHSDVPDTADARYAGVARLRDLAHAQDWLAQILT